ncbi:Hypothetical_protein [Hexamita inflata]|uniref:Hypothetical_protein n=1 Tax=Hexamita inflata TaxID=28002 RepID=A0ABP1HWR3_9EUKA
MTHNERQMVTKAMLLVIHSQVFDKFPFNQILRNTVYSSSKQLVVQETLKIILVVLKSEQFYVIIRIYQLIIKSRQREEMPRFWILFQLKLLQELLCQQLKLNNAFSTNM